MRAYVVDAGVSKKKYIMPEEFALIQRAQAGDAQAFETLYKTYNPRIYNIIAARAHPDDIEDLTQITFMRAFEYLSQFRGDANFTTWLTRIAHNVCYSQWRLRQQNQTRQNAIQTNTYPKTEETTPETCMHRTEIETLLQQSIAHLPEKYRQVIFLHYIKERSYEDLTRILHVPTGTVKTWLNRGRQELRYYLHKQGIYGLEIA